MYDILYGVPRNFYCQYNILYVGTENISTASEYSL
jgi:hypothetical protein